MSSFLGHGRAEDLKTTIVTMLSRDCFLMVKMSHLGCDVN